MTNLQNILTQAIENMPSRSAWDRAKKSYASEIAGTLIELEKYEGISFPMTLKEFTKYALNGANDWHHYSWSGCSHCYDYDIAKELCTPSQFKAKKEGALPPRKGKEWLDEQARALGQACFALYYATKNLV